MRTESFKMYGARPGDHRKTTEVYVNLYNPAHVTTPTRLYSIEEGSQINSQNVYYKMVTNEIAKSGFAGFVRQVAAGDPQRFFFEYLKAILTYRRYVKGFKGHANARAFKLVARVEQALRKQNYGMIWFWGGTYRET